MQKQHTVLIISPVLPYPPNDGGRLRTYKLCEALSEKYDFILIAPASDKEAEERKNSSKRFILDAVLVPKYGSSQSLGLCPNLAQKTKNKINDWMNLWQGMPSFSADPAMSQAIKRTLKDKSINLVQVEHLYSVQYLSLAEGMPKIVSAHNVETVRSQGFLGQRPTYARNRIIDHIDNFLIRLKSPIRNRRIQRIEANLNDLSDACIAVSEEDSHVLERLNPGLKIVTVPNGVDIDYFTPNADSFHDPTIVFSGHMGYYPNEDAVLYLHKDILPSVRSQIPNIKTIIVGKEPSPNILKLAIEDRSINVTGFVEDVRPYLRPDAVYVVPLRYGSGTRLKVLEAMAMEMAVVSTSIGCEGIDVEHNANIIIEDSPNAYAAAIIRLLKYAEQRKRLAKAGRQLVLQKYDWNIVAKPLDELYRRMLSHDGNR